MKKYILVALFVTSAASAQSVNINAGESLIAKCPQGSTPSVREVNSRTLSIYCESVCRVSVRESNLQVGYYIETLLPSGKKANSDVVNAQATANSQLQDFADYAVSKGWCDKAIID